MEISGTVTAGLVLLTIMRSPVGVVGSSGDGETIADHPRWSTGRGGRRWRRVSPPDYRRYIVGSEEPGGRPGGQGCSRAIVWLRSAPQPGRVGITSSPCSIPGG